MLPSLLSEGEIMERDDEQAIERPRGRHGRRRVVGGFGAAVLAIGLVAIGVAAGVWGERRASSGSSPQLTPVEAVRIYKELSEVERAFANLKDVVELRPIYHRTDPRVEAHIFIAALAFLLHRMLEKKLKAAGLDLSATEALQVLRTVRLVEFTLGRGQTKRSVTRGSARADTILAALGILDLDPPTPPTGAPTLM